MNPHKLLNNIKLLDLSERRSFRKFLVSPFFNQQKELKILFELLVQKLPNYQPNILSKKSMIKDASIDLEVDVLFKKIYPKEQATKNELQKKTKLYNLISDLNLAIEDFIAFTYYKKNPIQKYELITKYALQKSSKTLWNSSMRKFERETNKLGKGKEKLDYRLRLLRLRFDEPGTDHLDTLTSGERLKRVFETQKNIHVLDRVSLICGLLFRANAIEDKISFIGKADIESVVREISELSVDEYPLLHLYRSLIHLAQDQGKTKSLLSTSIDHFKRIRPQIDLKEQNQIIRYFLNYCTNQINKGKRSFLEDRFELEHWALQEGALLIDGILPDGIFINFCLNAITLGRQNLIATAINHYAPNLEESLRSQAIALVQAYRFFFDRKLEAALKEVQKVKFRRHNYAIRKMHLQLRIMFELFLIDRNRNYERLSTTIEAYLQFFQRNSYSLPKERKDGYLNLGRLTGKMIQYELEPNEKKKARLKVKIFNFFEQRQIAVSYWAKAVIEKLS